MLLPLLLAVGPRELGLPWSLLENYQGRSRLSLPLKENYSSCCSETGRGKIGSWACLRRPCSLYRDTAGVVKGRAAWCPWNLKMDLFGA